VASTTTTEQEKRAARFAEAARFYSLLGWALVKLDGKVPPSRDWQKAEPCQPEAAAGQWSVHGKRSNMGVVLGPSRLTVVEYDTDQALAKLDELMEGEWWPSMPVVESGSGRSRHFYFADEGYRAASRDGLELRCGAQQVVVPPSEHPDTGRPYRWIVKPTVGPLRPVPASVLDYFAANRSADSAGAVEEEIRKPGRHKALLSLAGSLRRRGLTAEEIAVALLAVNQARCRPPLPDREVAELARDVARRYDPAPPDPVQERLGREADRLIRDGGGGASGRGRDTNQEEERSDKRAAPPLIVTLEQYLAGSQDEAAWVVDHLIGRGVLTIVAGLPKVGKSTLVFGMLGAITTSENGGPPS
jgi:hypothetical protein